MSRFDYVKYDEYDVKHQECFKVRFEDLDVLVAEMANSRAKALVVTKLEEAYMWIGKAIRDDQIARNGLEATEMQDERKVGFSQNEK